MVHALALTHFFCGDTSFHYPRVTQGESIFMITGFFLIEFENIKKNINLKLKKVSKEILKY